MIYVTVILEIIKNLTKVFPRWYERWIKRKDLDYLEERDRIRRERDEAWTKVVEATGDEQEKLLQDYLDRYIRNR